MPDESCRVCGGTLVNCTQCAECKEAISMICQNCGSRTLEQFHDYCMSHVNFKPNYQMKNSNENIVQDVTFT